MTSMNGSKATDVEQREEIERIHETVVDIKVNVSFMIAGKIVQYEDISKMEVAENGAGVFWYNKKKANDSLDRILKDTKIAVSDSEREEEKKHERR